jgi:hypothetical protein
MRLSLCVTFHLFALLGVVVPSHFALAQGLLFRPSTQQALLLGTSPFSGELPKAIDLAGSQRLPKPGFQGKQVSCVGFAVAYVLKTYMEAVERKVQPDRDSLIYSPAYIFNQVRKGPTCSNGGAYFEDALELLKKEGVVTLNDFPYFPDDDKACWRLPSETLKQTAAAYKISSYEPVSNHNNPNAIKAHLAVGTPVLIGMMIDDVFKKWQGASVFKTYSGVGEGHAMVAVGYDDKLGAFRVANSFGESWGDRGYAWISYELFSDAKVLLQAFVARDLAILGGAGQQTRVEPIVALGDVEVYPNAVANNKPGVAFDIPVSVAHAQGRQLTLVGRFWHEGRQYAIVARPDERVFADARRQVAVSSRPTTVSGEILQERVRLFIPYEAINVPPTDPSNPTLYSLAVGFTAYLDNYPLARAPDAALAVLR